MSSRSNFHPRDRVAPASRTKQELRGPPSPGRPRPLYTDCQRSPCPTLFQRSILGDPDHQRRHGGCQDHKKCVAPTFCPLDFRIASSIVEAVERSAGEHGFAAAAHVRAADDPGRAAGARVGSAADRVDPAAANKFAAADPGRARRARVRAAADPGLAAAARVRAARERVGSAAANPCSAAARRRVH